MIRLTYHSGCNRSVGDLPNTDYGLPSDKAIGVDVGSSKVWTDTMGRQIEPKRYFRKKQKQLKRLQRKKYRQKNGSGNQKKTKQRIAKVHEKIARQRRGFNHQLSTKIVKEYGTIAVEDINFANLTRTPKAKLREDGKGYQENGRKRKAGLNKSLLDHGLGQLRDMIEAKSKSSDREFIKVKAAYTSQECSQCGHTSAENRSKKPMTKFLCVNCGHADHADKNAAINILNRGLKKFDRKYRIYPCLEGKVTPDSIGDVPIGDAESLTSKQMKQEAIHNSTLGQANPAISPNRGARPNSDQNQKLNIQSSNTDVARDSRRKRYRQIRANPQTHIQLTIWDLPAS